MDLINWDSFNESTVSEWRKCNESLKNLENKVNKYKNSRRKIITVINYADLGVNIGAITLSVSSAIISAIGCGNGIPEWIPMSIQAATAGILTVKSLFAPFWHGIKLSEQTKDLEKVEELCFVIREKLYRIISSGDEISRNERACMRKMIYDIYTISSKINSISSFMSSLFNNLEGHEYSRQQVMELRSLVDQISSRHEYVLQQFPSAITEQQIIESHNLQHQRRYSLSDHPRTEMSIIVDTNDTDI